MIKLYDEYPYNFLPHPPPPFYQTEDIRDAFNVLCDCKFVCLVEYNGKPYDRIDFIIRYASLVLAPV